MHPVGLFLGLLMPVFTAGLIVMVALLLRRYGPRGSFVLAPLLVLGPAYADFLYGEKEFHKACRVSATPLVLERAQADGFLLQSDTATGFGARYLDSGFRWIERKSAGGGWERVAAGPDGVVSAQPIREPMAKYLVIEKVERTAYWVLASTSVLERESGRLLSAASHAAYAGGRFAQLLTPFNHASCPRAQASGAKPAWQIVDELPALTLQPHRREVPKSP